MKYGLNPVRKKKECQSLRRWGWLGRNGFYGLGAGVELSGWFRMSFSI
jgi:hypothetical protein